MTNFSSEILFLINCVILTEFRSMLKTLPKPMMKKDYGTNRYISTTRQN